MNTCHFSLTNLCHIYTVHTLVCHFQSKKGLILPARRYKCILFNIVSPGVFARSGRQLWARWNINWEVWVWAQGESVCWAHAPGASLKIVSPYSGVYMGTSERGEQWWTSIPFRKRKHSLLPPATESSDAQWPLVLFNLTPIGIKRAHDS